MKNKLRIPSRKCEVVFREPTVQDSIDLASIHPDHEEQAVSWWLNTLQDGKKKLPAEEMTQEDRQCCLLLTFFMTQSDTARRVTYDCQFYGKSHPMIVDYAELATVGLEEKDEVPSVELLDGEFTMRPLDGQALEELEMERLGNPTIKQEQIRLSVVAKRLSLTSEDLIKLPVKKYYDLLKEMDEKLPLLFHGIDFTKSDECPEGGGTNQISLPFQTADFLPRV